MGGVTDWLEEQNFAELALHANRPPGELRQVIVTPVMTEAAMGYIQSLYDPLMSVGLLEEVFRIMVVLQPQALATKARPLSLSQISGPG